MGEKQMEVCEVCGAFLIVGDAQSRVDDHLSGKQHVGYARIKSTIAKRKEAKLTREGIEEGHVTGATGDRRRGGTRNHVMSEKDPETGRPTAAGLRGKGETPGRGEAPRIGARGSGRDRGTGAAGRGRGGEKGSGRGKGEIPGAGGHGAGTRKEPGGAEAGIKNLRGTKATGEKRTGKTREARKTKTREAGERRKRRRGRKSREAPPRRKEKLPAPRRVLQLQRSLRSSSRTELRKRRTELTNSQQPK